MGRATTTNGPHEHERATAAREGDDVVKRMVRVNENERHLYTCKAPIRYSIWPLGPIRVKAVIEMQNIKY